MASNSSHSALITQKHAARNRLHELILEDGRPGTSFLNAYKLKSELKKLEQATPVQDYCKIRTLDPLIVIPEKKFEHCPGALMSHYNPRPMEDERYLSQPKTLKKKIEPSHIHNRLSSVDSYPDVYKKKFDNRSIDVSGNYIEDPKKAIGLLKSTSSAKLNIPGRAADFNSEVRWRMLLRNN